ncbi:MAG: hypothetical protein EON59_11290 [Alphaproteobacteria bacterium]|nr:MAG: hypothetical protein EON59_11290 [Alphaproteobacteria bacterium]
MDIFPTLEGALNIKFRGHGIRDWAEWREKHFYGEAADIPAEATNAWIGRQKLSYRGIGKRRTLRHLIGANVDQPFLNEIGELENLERLELEWPMVAKDLTPILRLERLAFLSIDSPRNIADFRPLLALPSLRTLIITNPKKMTNLDWLGEAHQLEVIGIEGGTWSPYTIPTLRPLAGLRSLRAFLGVSTKLSDESLAPLADCSRLEYLGIACVAPQAEFDRLKMAKPDLVCDWFRPGMWAALRSTDR